MRAYYLLAIKEKFQSLKKNYRNDFLKLGFVLSFDACS